MLTNPICWLFNWHLNAAKAYKRIPDRYKMHIVSKIDHMIHYKQASLHARNRVSPTYKGYSYKMKETVNGHNAPLHELMDKKMPATPLNTHIARFVARP